MGEKLQNPFNIVEILTDKFNYESNLTADVNILYSALI